MSYMPPAKSDIHITPDNVFIEIWNQWGIYKEDFFDPCPLNPKFDGLNIDWKPLNYVNPPYSNLKDWVDKAYFETKQGRKTIMLLPSKTEQGFFHFLLEKNYEIKWIRKRLKFKNNKHGATQPHFLVLVQ